MTVPPLGLYAVFPSGRMFPLNPLNVKEYVARELNGMVIRCLAVAPLQSPRSRGAAVRLFEGLADNLLDSGMDGWAESCLGMASRLRSGTWGEVEGC